MRKIFTLAILALCCCSNTCFADDFIVTSNADSGPGSLREAITLANSNGSTSTDRIHFNIADISIAGRTITIITDLPKLTSNIILDGTTQPGNRIGVSDAKIRITCPAGNGIFAVFDATFCTDIEIYGFHFHDIKPAPNPAGQAYGQGVIVFNTTRIKVGAAGKGNYFTKLGSAVGRAWPNFPGRGWSKDISFKGNIVNMTEDGTNHIMGSNGPAMSLENPINLEIGGELPGEGNYITSIDENCLYVTTDTFAQFNSGYVKIIGNKLGCNYNETEVLYGGTIYFYNGQYTSYYDTTHFIVKNNSFNCKPYAFSSTPRGFLKIYNKRFGYIDIKNNRIGLLGSAQNFFYSLINYAFAISGCNDGIIGGDGPEDKNYIAGVVGGWSSIGISLGNNRNIKISKNAIFCNSEGINAFSSFVQIPDTKIFTITDHTVAGTTLANSTVEVFLTRQCATQGCKNAEIYLGSTVADASGNWTFTTTTLLDGPVTATGTSPTGATGKIARPEFVFGNVYAAPTCGMNNGYIHSMQFISGTRYYWVKNDTDTIFSLNLDNIGPGNYVFVTEQGPYCKVTQNIYLGDNSPVVHSQNASLIHPTCGRNNGGIANVFASGNWTQVFWKDAGNNIVSNTANLSNVGPGQYKMVALNTTYGCGDSSQYFTLINQAGPELNFNNLQIQNATCSNSNGSINGITSSNVNGTAYIVWVNVTNQQTIATSLNATGLPAGNYQLKFRDQSNCDTLYSPVYTITAAGAIAIDTSGKNMTPADCATSNGGISNIIVSGADTYQWLNAAGQVVSNSLILTNVPAGAYVLMASNSLGCQKKTDTLRITTRPFINQGNPLQAVITPATCNSSNGSVQVNAFPSSQQYQYSWEAAIQPGTSIGNSLNMAGLSPGTYYLLARNAAGCEEKIYTAVIPFVTPVKTDVTGLRISAANCGLQDGSITGLKPLTGTGSAPFSYEWLLNNSIAANTQQLANAAAGNYTMVLTDANGCKDTVSNLVIADNNLVFPPPVYESVTIRSGSAAELVVSNFQAGTYSLYDGPASSTALQQNTTGRFSTGVLQEDKTFYISFSKGNCSSSKTKVEVKVFSRTDIYVPSVFTPNKDGRNELLRPVIFGPVKLEYFTIYNRYGYSVFSTNEINKGWDGSYKNELQPMATYTWILKCRDILTGEIFQKKGSSTLIR